MTKRAATLISHLLNLLFVAAPVLGEAEFDDLRSMSCCRIQIPSSSRTIWSHRGLLHASTFAAVPGSSYLLKAGWRRSRSRETKKPLNALHTTVGAISALQKWDSREGDPQ